MIVGNDRHNANTRLQQRQRLIHGARLRSTYLGDAERVPRVGLENRLGDFGNHIQCPRVCDTTPLVRQDSD